MYAAAPALLKELGGFATTAQLLTVMTRQQLRVQVQKGGLVRVWYGVYAAADPDLIGRLAALDLFMGQRVVACMGTAAALHGFDLENTCAVHVLDPGVRMRPTVGLMVHQRTGAPLQRVAGRLATAPAWTAVEVARQLRRPRALAALDAALHSLACTRAELESAVREQKGRRGIVQVRELVQYADGRAESGMESEARLVMIDFGLPRPELQYEIHGRHGELWRVDFAWPDQRVAAEYESLDWHVGKAEMLSDKKRFAGVQELAWTVIPIVVDDVRRQPRRLADRIDYHLSRAPIAR
jgi:very-short-patch-repair endonuclease